MGKLTRRENAEGVLTHLRAVGPQPVAEIKVSLGITKREVEEALQLLSGQGRVEYDWPVTSPLRYMASREVA